jgi:hypothetical protein
MAPREVVRPLDDLGRVGDFDEVRDSRLERTTENVFAVLVEALVAQVAMGIDHATRLPGRRT